MTDEKQENTPQWGKMDDLEFVDFTRTMMEKVCKHITDSVEDVDAAEMQAEYSTPVKFAQDIISLTIASEVLEGDYKYLQSESGDNSEA